jgi:outer membrane protein
LAGLVLATSINSERLAAEFDTVELVPIDAPSMQPYEVSMQESMQFAVQMRPEILQALKQIKAGSIRLGMTRNELLPQLDLITQTYVAGLEGGGSIGDAWTGQFGDGRPGYSVGLNYEVPFGNRASEARNLRRKFEFRQLNNQYLTTLQTVKLEVEVAVREIQASRQEMYAKSQAMQARSAQLDAMTKRWQQLPGEDVSASLALENLLTSQRILAEAEFEFLQSQLTYNLAQMNLKRVTGLLLRAEGIGIGEAIECGLPKLTPAQVNPPESFLLKQPQVGSDLQNPTFFNGN